MLKYLQRKQAKEPIESPIAWVSLCFSLITVVNSLMMITGLDTPKQGVFAYVHILSRLVIIIIMVSLFMISEWREIITQKTLFSSFKEALFKSIHLQYTLVVVLYCALNITFSPLYYIPSGYFFYITLVGMYLVIGSIMIVKRILKRKV